MLGSHATFARLWKKHHPGKAYTGGLFKYAVNINYLGYALWRIGMSVHAHSLPSLLVCSVVIVDFLRTQIHEVAFHNSQKYGREFDAYYARTAKLIPFVY